MSNEQRGRDPQADFSNLEFGNGLAVVGKLQGLKGIRYQLRCAVCGSVGQTITQEQMATGVVPKCGNSGCGKVSTETRRTAQFGFTPDPSVRNRAERKQEQEVLATMVAEEQNNA